MSEVTIWDLGPKRPKAPEKPVAPVLAANANKAAQVEFELAMVDYEDAAEHYKNELRTFGAARQEFDVWERDQGGPVARRMQTVDAREAKERNADRFVDQLPKGMKPGRGHFENLERDQARQSDIEDARQRDPQFGKQGAAA